MSETDEALSVSQSQSMSQNGHTCTCTKGPVLCTYIVLMYLVPPDNTGCIIRYYTIIRIIHNTTAFLVVFIHPGIPNYLRLRCITNNIILVTNNTGYYVLTTASIRYFTYYSILL